MIDLHTHTDQSDGTTPPEQLIREAVDLGLEALAITDHDILDGYDRAFDAAAEAKLELICGVELSTRLSTPPPPGKRNPSVHVLGYFLDGPAPTGFREWLWNWQESRRKRNLALVERLQSLGLDIRLEEAQALGKNLTGRPHFAKVMLKKGFVSTIQEAFDRYLADDAQAAVSRDEPTVEEGIEWIRKSGGMAVIAHPFRLPNADDATSLRQTLGGWKESGLNGLEVYYSEHSPEQTALYAELAGQLGLTPTGGSDYHGTNKPGISLGTGKQGNLNIQYSLLEAMRA